MIKKIFSLFTIALLATAMVACSEKDNKSGNTDGGNNSLSENDENYIAINDDCANVSSRVIFESGHQ
ncbi:MAG: hypothetical protein ACSW8I_09565 [bacterium]